MNKKKVILVLITVFICSLVVWNISTIYARNKAAREDLKVPYTYSVINPYESINWSSYKPYKANLHTHTNFSDGKLDIHEIIDRYYYKGYDILSITDHNMVIWPWKKYGRDPEKLDMLAVRGSEISNTDHIGSYFADYTSKSYSENKVIKEIGKEGGLAVMFHPGRYNRSISWYSQLYKRYDHLVGFEVINMWNKYKYDEQTWDKILVKLMPERPVWGFANDDMHSARQIGLDWNTFFLPRLTEKALKNAMKKGHFYFTSVAVVNEPEGKPPRINRISVDKKKNTIRIEAENYNSIRWISGNTVLHEGDILRCNNLKGVQGYVRAVVIGKGGKCYTQPFGMVKQTA